MISSNCLLQEYLHKVGMKMSVTSPCPPCNSLQLQTFRLRSDICSWVWPEQATWLFSDWFYPSDAKMLLSNFSKCWENGMHNGEDRASWKNTDQIWTWFPFGRYCASRWYGLYCSLMGTEGNLLSCFSASEAFTIDYLIPEVPRTSWCKRENNCEFKKERERERSLPGIKMQLVEEH